MDQQAKLDMHPRWEDLCCNCRHGCQFVTVDRRSRKEHCNGEHQGLEVWAGKVTKEDQMFIRMASLDFGIYTLPTPNTSDSGGPQTHLIVSRTAKMQV